MKMVIVAVLYLIGTIVYGIWNFTDDKFIKSLKNNPDINSMSRPVLFVILIIGCFLWPIGTIIDMRNIYK